MPKTGVLVKNGCIMLYSHPVKKKPLSLYVHIPFCERRCDYCDFTSFDDCASQIPSYLDALCSEIADYGLRCKQHRVETIFFGGGTPSLLSVAQITKLMSCLRSCFNIDKAAEVTIECNPESLTQKKLEAYLGLGINRISIGIQSTNPITLQTLGRVHTPERAMRAVGLASMAGFENINIDIMYNVPISRELSEGNLRRNLAAELHNILGANPWVTHISAYSTTVASGTELARRLDYEELYELDDESCIEEELDLLYVLKDFGFNRYEVSNFARKGFECKHNRNYWTARVEYLGLGLGASGLFNGERYENTDNINMYLLNPNKVTTREVRSLHDCVNEAILLGLRTKQGVSIKRLEELGVNILAGKAKELMELKSHNLIRVTKDSIKPTKDGSFVLNAIIERLLFDKEEISGTI